MINRDNFCYNIFHIPGYGASHKFRFKLSRDIDTMLSKHFNRLLSPTIKISNKEDYKNFCEKDILNIKSRMQYGEVGIWASNLLSIREFLETDYQYLMLMEDDIVFTDDFVVLLDKYIEQLPDNWDMFSYFAHYEDYYRYEDTNSEDDVVPAYQDWSMLCYVINRKCAQKIIDSVSQDGISQPIDWFMYRNKHLFNVYTLSPKAEKACILVRTESTFQAEVNYGTF